jgi:hypothetical protein
VSLRLALVSIGVTLVSLAVAVWGFGLSYERAVLLAPVFVLTVGAAAAFVLIGAKIVLESRSRRRP